MQIVKNLVKRVPKRTKGLRRGFAKPEVPPNYGEDYKINQKNWDYYRGQIQESLKIANKAYWRSKLEADLVEQSRIELVTLRKRRPDDKLEELLKKKQCGGFITWPNGDDPVHFVIEQSQAKALWSAKDSTLRPVSVFVEGREYECRLNVCDRHPCKSRRAKKLEEIENIGEFLFGSNFLWNFFSY